MRTSGCVNRATVSFRKGVMKTYLRSSKVGENENFISNDDATFDPQIVENGRRVNLFENVTRNLTIRKFDAEFDRKSAYFYINSLNFLNVYSKFPDKIL